MNRQEALDVITAMAAAWPYPEWEESRIELWVAALEAEDVDAARAAVVQTVRERDTCPSIAWFLEAIDFAEKAGDLWKPTELEAPAASKETALAAIAAARAALGGVG